MFRFFGIRTRTEIDDNAMHFVEVGKGSFLAKDIGLDEMKFIDRIIRNGGIRANPNAIYFFDRVIVITEKFDIFLRRNQS